MYTRVVLIIVLLTCTLTHSIKITDFLNKLSRLNVHLLSEKLDKSDMLNSSQLIATQGYPVEEHFVYSHGYRLTMFRIPGKGPSVMVVHGIISSSDDLLTLGSKSLAINLARRGYDVWLANVRGNFYSRYHTTLSPDDALFWDFSWHDIGVCDLPAMIDYVCNTAGVFKIGYIGHSQGTTVVYVLLSERPEYNDKISVVVSLSSVAWMGNSTSKTLKELAKDRKKEELALKTLGINELLTREQLWICGTSAAISYMCLTTFIYAITGPDYEQIDHDRLKSQLLHYPSGSALKQFMHFLQNIDGNSFQKYDYGPSGNVKMYGTAVVPSYTVENIRTNMVIFWSQNDFPSNYNDIQQLRSKLPKPSELYEVKLHSFNHMDYVWGRSADELVYCKVFKYIHTLIALIY